MLGNGKIGGDTLLGEYQMAADLSSMLPPGLLKRLCGSLARDVRQLSHAFTPRF